jgi:hypothetical protein
MADKAHFTPPHGPTETPDLITAAQDKAENAIVLWQHIECHLLEAKNQISKIRQMIQKFDLRAAGRDEPQSKTSGTPS